jgi:hypothetical protein
MMETMLASETLVLTRATRRHTLEDRIPQIYLLSEENLRLPPLADVAVLRLWSVKVKK